ncbi:MAG: TlpA family protein disulfide reductase [Oscillospiraceae bacterium]|nr:TlpA family protein disulfide reductase [Oscillospiraceae bacterium]
MKKILAIVLTVLTLVSVSAASFALEGTESYDAIGITVTYPEEMKDITAMIMPIAVGDTFKDGVYRMAYEYFALTKEEQDEMSRKNAEDGKLSEEDVARVTELTGFLLDVYAIDGGRGVKEIIVSQSLEEKGVTEDMFTEIGKEDDVTWYALTGEKYYEDFLKKISPDFAKEFSAIQPVLIEALKEAEYFKPYNPKDIELAGRVLSFETTDLDGNVIKSEELFAAHKITMLNIWATWCGPCKAEMEELGEIDRRLAEEGKDAVIVGICDDAGENPEGCKEILAEKKDDYLNILPYDGMLEELGITSIPTTIFVDSKGTILTNALSGVPEDISLYEVIIDALLASAG